MKRVLIITYYWPPSGGAGVQRWLKFVKYLGEFGWEAVVYTPENPEYPAIDESLLKDIPVGIEVIKQPIWEPYSWYRKLLGQKDKKIGSGFVSEEKGDGLVQKLSVWIRGNFFIPDARKFWIKPSVKFLSNYLKENPMDAVISTGPPHSMHLIALALKKELGLKWVADFRDPWTNIDFYQELMLSKWADLKHHQLEQEVLKLADLTLTIGYTMTEEFKALGAKRVETITNGFDDEDFPETDVELDDHFTISHIGTFSPSRNHLNLWKALSELKHENPDFAKKLKIRTVGTVDHSVATSIAEFGLSEQWERIPYVSHAELLSYQRSSRVLLVCINDSPNASGILPGKFFEYLASRRPILAVGSIKSDIGTVLNETNAGSICDPDDLEGLKKTILQLFESSWMETEQKSSKVANYSRRKLTNKLADLLNQITA